MCLLKYHTAKRPIKWKSLFTIFKPWILVFLPISSYDVDLITQFLSLRWTFRHLLTSCTIELQELKSFGKYIYLWILAIVVLSLSHVQLFSDFMDCSPLGSSVHRNSQARILERVALSSNICGYVLINLRSVVWTLFW